MKQPDYKNLKKPPTALSLYVIMYDGEVGYSRNNIFTLNEQTKNKIRPVKGADYITNSFPCNLGARGHIHPFIKNLVKQPNNIPNDDPWTSRIN